MTMKQNELQSGQVLASNAVAPKRDSYVIPDIRAFLYKLDLKRPELALVKAELDRGDTPAAGKAYIAYFRARRIESPLLTDWRATARDPGHVTERADAFLAGHLHDGYSAYEVPAAGLNWRESPLSCVTRFPLLVPVRAAYHNTRDPKYGRWLTDHMLGFVRAWPMSEYVGHDSREGFTNHTTTAKPWYWVLLPDRLAGMSESICLLRAGPEVTDDELLELLRRLLEEAGYCRQEIGLWVREMKHNGGCYMIKCLAMACAVLDDFLPTREYIVHDAEMAAFYLDQAFYPDGMNIELTVAYSRGSSFETQEFCYALRNTPAINAQRDKVAALATCLAGLTEPMGGLPSFGDLYAPGLDGAICRPALEWLALPWINALLDGRGGPVPPFTSWPAPGQPQWCGYYAMRSDWTRTARYLCIDAGPWGTTHQHGDKLSFALDAHGARFIIDPSSTRYAANEPDAFISRQTAGFLHNTITVDGVDEFWFCGAESTPLQTLAPLQNRWEQGPSSCLFAGRYSFHPVKPVEWERRMLFVGGQYWLLQDVLTGAQPGADVEQNFQFEADIKIEFDGARTIAIAPNGARLLLVPLTGGLVPKLSLGDRVPHITYWPDGKPKTVPSEWVVEQGHGRGWTGRGGRMLLPAPAVTYAGKMTLPGTLTLALIPLRPDQSLTELPSIGSQTNGGITTWTLPYAQGEVRLQTGIGDCRIVLQ